MAENEEPMEIEIDNESLDEKVNKFNQALANGLLNAPKLFETIVNEANAHPNVDLAKVYNAASQLADAIKAASPYKQRELTTAVSKLESVPKILISREFKEPLSESHFSVEAALSSPIGIGYNKRSVYKKVALHKTLAYGDNTNGRLGVEGGDEQVTSLTEVSLPKDLKIIDIYMSHFHTIFVMDNGEVYGVGKAENFLSNGTTGILTVPVKLDYVRIDPKRERPFCRVTNCSTVFFNYKKGLDLVVSVNQFGCAMDGGPNWSLVPKTPSLTQHTTVKLDSILAEIPRKYHIDSDANWLPVGRERREIVLIICGRRISTRKFGSDISFCPGGIVYAHRNGTLYKGQLATAYRREEGDCDNDKEARDDEGLVALMKEVVLPFYVDGFYVDRSGNSLIFYKKNVETDDSVSPLIDKLDGMNTYWSSEPCFPDLETIYKPADPSFPRALRTSFAELVQSFPEDLASIVYSPRADAEQPDQFFTGLPKAGIRFLRTLLHLQNFLKLGEGTRVPHVLLKLDKLDASGFQKNLRKDFEGWNDMVPSFRVLIAADTEEGEARKTEIIGKAKIFIKEVIDNITNSLKCLVCLPLKYRREERDTQFCQAVKLIIDCVKEEFMEMNSLLLHVVFEKLSTFDFVKKAIEDRLKYKDMNTEDPRLKSIRVEAIPIEYTGQNYWIKYHYIHTTSTEFFIKLIDEKLLDSVEDGVLNLNNACLDDREQFVKYFKVFFDFPVTYENFQAYENHSFYDIDTICMRLPETEKYVVATSDDQMIEVPAFPFQLYCNGFDAARLRSSSASHLELPVPTSAKAVKHLAEALLDIPSLFSVDMKTKEEIFQLADAMLITHLKPHLIQMIVMTAEQEDIEFISFLFGVYADEMIENVAKHRPDIIFHWQKLPFDTSNLNILSKISELIHKNFFVEQDTPITLAEDRHVDYEGIDKKWLISVLSDKEQDEDVMGALNDSIMLWDGFVKRTRKRKHSDSDSGEDSDSEADQ